MKVADSVRADGIVAAIFAKGADASAMMYSVAATACANGMKVEDYLTELFRSLPGTLVMPW